MSRSIVFLILFSLSAFAAEPWPPAKFAEVRAYAWPADPTTAAVILPGMRLQPDVINPDGAKLSHEQIKRLRAAVSGAHPNHGRALCYIPHNAFVFYDAAKKPVAFVEICFACCGYRAEPEGTAKNYDILTLASIFSELHLPMGEYLDLNAFRKSRIFSSR